MTLSSLTLNDNPSPPVLGRQGSPPIAIPQFYFPGAARSSAYKAAVDKVDAFFAVYPQGLSLDNLKALLKQVFSLPTSLAYPLFYKMTPGEEGLVSRAALISWLDRAGFWAQDAAGRAYRVLCAPGATGVTPADLKPVLAGILISHPGLEFLADSPEFQERYAETVIHCIFYALDRSGTGRLRLRELRRGDLLDALGEVDEQDDINRVSRYFSYEHFYVIYCKFWDLDTDHDFMLSRDDLLRYGNHALTFRIIERIFSQAARPFSTGNPAQMGYEDFVWFILSGVERGGGGWGPVGVWSAGCSGTRASASQHTTSHPASRSSPFPLVPLLAEEDKTTDTSLEYWFRSCDLDGDGVLHSSELYVRGREIVRVKVGVRASRARAVCSGLSLHIHPADLTTYLVLPFFPPSLHSTFTRSRCTAWSASARRRCPSQTSWASCTTCSIQRYGLWVTQEILCGWCSAMAHPCTVTCAWRTTLLTRKPSPLLDAPTTTHTHTIKSSKPLAEPIVLHAARPEAQPSDLRDPVQRPVQPQQVCAV